MTWSPLREGEEAGRGWSPWVEGETAARALAAAVSIARDLTQASGPGLSRGHAGLALFFAYLERSLGRAEAGELAQHHLELAIDELSEQPIASPSLYFGFTGVAWVIEHLTAEDPAGDDDPNAEIDAALLSLLGRAPWKGEHDLLGGLVGLGVYALERLPRAPAAAMIPLLVARLSERIGGETRELAARDPGMAHGAAGVIALLARLIEEGAAGPEAAALLTATVDGVLPHLFPGNGGEEEDLAWCSGGAGLSAALLAASRAGRRDDWELAARRLAVAMAERRPGDTRSFDPALCHGTAGLSHLFYRLYQATGHPAVLAAARHWLEHTLAARRPGEGIGGYLCLGRQEDGRRGWIVNPGFLDGAAGTGLALLAAATPVAPAWDRLLLLSGCGGGRRQEIHEP
jgi:lantibiotic modifying enzyme